MIFIYGTGTSRLITAPLPTTTCAHCGTRGQLSVTVFSRYVSLFWIPVFPFGKLSVTVCNHCKQTLTSKEPLPESYRLPVQTVQQHAPRRLTNFALPLLLLAGVVLIVVLARLGPARPSSASAATVGSDDAGVTVGARYKTQPMAGTRGYALLEVTRLTPDTVYYKTTTGLLGKPTAASVAVALRDSVPPGAERARYPRAMWHFLVEGQGMFRPFVATE
ncbi:zinc ribbon domain-containing protein [Hymenobacter rigui]|uniref:Zinc-ribbon domain-containing protein n=1 Tax=Hymenobacter rigui TaxID=334424 RepID=A0A428KU52_9BACT|nr:zinc-ribbon domain-containing protein [Hymenobacter rigui]RSK50235.1 zinc-ribbon domain-containing protein [Hymenobacter rigui]